jgi:NADH dehydrogenase [ubiquinone] 1 alpha subcomplex assembly factor 5
MQRFTLRTLHSPNLIRSFASVGAPPPQATTPFEVFDRQAKRRQRDRAAVRGDGAQSRVTDYLRAEVADRMLERFEVSVRLLSR